MPINPWNFKCPACGGMNVIQQFTNPTHKHRCARCGAMW